MAVERVGVLSRANVGGRAAVGGAGWRAPGLVDTDVCWIKPGLGSEEGFGRSEAHGGEEEGKEGDQQEREMLAG